MMKKYGKSLINENPSKEDVEKVLEKAEKENKART